MAPGRANVGDIGDSSRMMDPMRNLEDPSDPDAGPVPVAADLGVNGAPAAVHFAPRPRRPESLPTAQVIDTAAAVELKAAPVSIGGKSVRLGDQIFKGLAAGSGGLLLVIMAAIAAFLIWKAAPAFTGNAGNLITTQVWNPGGSPPVFGMAALLFGTLMSSIIALLLGVPVAIGIALFISQYANKRLAVVLAAVVDLLAAVPSLIFGMWGLYFLIPETVGFQKWLTDYFGWIPLFGTEAPMSVNQYGKSLLMAGIILAIMILPIVSAVSREVFRQTPRETIDAALALGATKWESIRTAVLPFGRPGMISAAMLGLGRALGETIAVALVLNSGFKINWHLTEPGGDTFSSTIANKFGEAEASPLGIPALITAGLFLFVITLVVNSFARWVIARRQEFV